MAYTNQNLSVVFTGTASLYLLMLKHTRYSCPFLSVICWCLKDPCAQVLVDAFRQLNPRFIDFSESGSAQDS